MEPSRARKAAAWSVHAYTALGLPLAFVATISLANGDARGFFLAQVVAAFVDATDGALARKVGVRQVLPNFDGRRLDDIIDFLNFAFLPCLGLVGLAMLPAGWGWLGVVPLLASGYGFSQDNAKTDDSFVGFPSYWNVLVLYFYVLRTDPTAAAASLVLFSVLVFVPVHYLYPSKTRLLRPVTVVLGFVWAAAITVLALWPDATWARPLAIATLFYPAYYFGLSFVHHHRIARAYAEG